MILKKKIKTLDFISKNKYNSQESKNKQNVIAISNMIGGGVYDRNNDFITYYQITICISYI